MAAEQPARRPKVLFNLPPCEWSWLLHLRDGEPIGIVIDGQAYAVRPRRRSTGVRDGDQLVTVVELVSND